MKFLKYSILIIVSVLFLYTITLASGGWEIDSTDGSSAGSTSAGSPGSKFTGVMPHDDDTQHQNQDGQTLKGSGWQLDDDNTSFDTSSSGGIGTVYNPTRGPYYSHLSLQDIPADLQEACSAQFRINLTSSWNLSHLFWIYFKSSLLTAFSSNPSAGELYLKSVKNYHAALKEVVNSYPRKYY